MYHNQVNQKTSFLKKAGITFFVLALMFVSFLGGMYISGRNDVIKELAREEAVYLGKIIGKYNQPEKGPLIQDINFDLFWDVWDTIEREYVDKDKINEKEMFYGALYGLVGSIGDPYTIFMDPKMAQEFEESLSGTFEGIGAEIGIREDILTIIAPLTGMPAEKAGLMSGDRIYAINEESTAGITIDEAVKKIRGQKGTDVTLTISRDGLEAAQNITITRGTIVVNSVQTTIKDSETKISKDAKTKDDDIFVIEISNFNNDTLNLFNKAINEVIKINPKGIILDLRNNPGGYLDTAVEVASEWIEEGIVVTEEFDTENKNEFLSRGRARLKNYKTIVLVNQGSASASEIVAGALQDYEKATIVGMQTFGKGSVQTIENFYDGSSVKITVAKWLTPDGNYINEEGITPDIEIDLTIEDYKNDLDPQMDKAIELLNIPLDKGDLGD